MLICMYQMWNLDAKSHTKPKIQLKKASEITCVNSMSIFRAGFRNIRALCTATWLHVTRGAPSKLILSSKKKKTLPARLTPSDNKKATHPFDPHKCSITPWAGIEYIELVFRFY